MTDYNNDNCEQCDRVHRFAGVECPTCIYLGKTGVLRGTMFWQHVEDTYYECSMDDHIFDPATLGILETLTPWNPRKPAEQADQPIEESRDQVVSYPGQMLGRKPTYSDCPSPIGTVCKDPSCRLHYPKNHAGQIERDYKKYNREIDRRVREEFYPGSTGNPTEK